MYSLEQIETRLRLGHGLSNMELGQLAKHLFMRIDSLEKNYEELSKNRRESSPIVGEVVQSTTIRPKPKQ